MPRVPRRSTRRNRGQDATRRGAEVRQSKGAVGRVNEQHLAASVGRGETRRHAHRPTVKRMIIPEDLDQVDAPVLEAHRQALGPEMMDLFVRIATYPNDVVAVRGNARLQEIGDGAILLAEQTGEHLKGGADVRRAPREAACRLGHLSRKVMLD